jgi:hypothetical protein
MCRFGFQNRLLVTYTNLLMHRYLQEKHPPEKWAAPGYGGVGGLFQLQLDLHWTALVRSLKGCGRTRSFG